MGVDELNAIQGKLAVQVTPIGNLGDTNFTGAVTGLVGDISARSGTGWRCRNEKPFIKAYFAGQSLLGETLFIATGQVLNPNMELLFQGPTLHIVNFNFKLCPRELDEAGI